MESEIAEKLKEYIRQNNFKHHEIISIGDTSEEIEIAHSLGLYSVAVSGGENTTVRLKKHRPDFLINNMLELKKIIKKLNQV